MHITANSSLANTLPWKVWETGGNVADHVAKVSQPIFETLSWAATSLCNLATPAMSASISIGKRSPSKACMIISLLVLGSASSASTPASTSTVSAVIPDFLINNYTNGSQEFPSIATFSDGSFVVTWDGEGPGDSNGVFGQRFFANGSAWGLQFRVNTYRSGVQYRPSTVPFSDDSFIVTWAGEGDGDSSGIFGQLFFDNGSPRGSEFRANSYTNGEQLNPSTIVFSDGSFVVTWHGEGNTDDVGIFGQLFFPTGAALGLPFRINSYTDGEQWNPSTAPFSDDSFVVTWWGEGDGDSSGIFGQLFFDDGSPLGSEFRANSYTNGEQLNPSTIVLSDGSFAVTWWGEGTGDNNLGIFGQQFFANGSTWGSEFRANTHTNGDQSNPSIAAFSDSTFVVTWWGEGSGDSIGIFGQRFFDNGSAWGSEFRVNSYTIGSQEFPNTATFSDGAFVVTWRGEETPGSSVYSVYGKRFDMFGQPILEERTSLSPSTLSMEAPTSNLNTLTTTPSLLNSASPSLQSTKQSSSSTFSSSFLSLFSGSSIQNRETTVTSQGSIPSITTFAYEESYPIIVNGETIGTFTFSGGSGQLDSSNVNTLNIQLDPDLTIEDGDTLTLFTFAGDEGSFENIVINGRDDECIEAEGEVVENPDGTKDYQAVITKTNSCLTAGSRMLRSSLSLLSVYVPEK